MRVETPSHQRENQISKAMCADENVMTYRQARVKFHMPKSTVFDSVRRSKLIKAYLHWQPALNASEE